MANKKITDYAAQAAPDASDLLVTVDVSDVSMAGTGTDKKMTLSTLMTAYILPTMYPIGSLYANYSNSTNPGTIFGFGTWVVAAAGRTIVGVGTSDQAFAAAATGGESTHVLTIPEMPSHNHTIQGKSSSGSGASVCAASSVTGQIGPTDYTGGGGAHNNLQPYETYYLWRRTA